MSKKTNLTNACSMISFMTAQRFMSTTGKPTNKELCSTFSDSAPRMRVLREKLGRNPDDLEEVDLYDLRRILNKWYLEDTKSFENMFPNMIEIFL